MIANAGTLERRYERFVNNCKKSTIEKYFGINTDSDSNLEIEISKLKISHAIKKNTKITLDIHYFKKNKIIYNFNNLPIEIIRKIQEYGDYYIDMEIDVYFPNEYPFVQPLWCLKNIKHNIKVEQLVNIKEYYSNIISNHNKQNETNWSPATELEKDILEFILKINHFEYLFYEF